MYRKETNNVTKTLELNHARQAGSEGLSTLFLSKILSRNKETRNKKLPHTVVRNSSQTYWGKMEQLNHVNHHAFHFDVHPSYFLAQTHQPMMMMQYQPMLITHNNQAAMPPLPRPPRVRKPLEVRDPKTHQLIDLPKRDFEVSRAKRAASHIQVLSVQDFPPLPHKATTTKQEEEDSIQAFSYRDATSKHM